jgi:peptidyl-tRNA hydrolase, PTH1 family
MKYLIAGLGNMDNAYYGTRHNIGFDVADHIVSRLSTSFQSASLAHKAEASYKGKKLIIIKPTTYMNLSGKAVRYWMEKEAISLEKIIVILDDFNIDFGSIRLRPSGTDGGHNGLKDIQDQLQSNQYARLRVGIGNAFGKGQQVEYVLGKWNPHEIKYLPQIIELASEAALSFCFAGLKNTMNLFNAKSIECTE